MEQLPLPSRQVVSGSSDLPIFRLGDFFLGTVTRGMENFYGIVQKVMRKWSNDAIVRSLLKLMILLNPRLNAHQRGRLLSILLKAVDQLVWEHAVDPRVLSGIMALACPNQDTGLLFGYLMEVIARLASVVGQPEECAGRQTSHVDAESPMTHSIKMQKPHSNDMWVGLMQKDDEEMTVAQALFRNFCVEQANVAAMPPNVRKAVLGALNGGMEFPAQLQSWVLVSNQCSPPICSITLEPLLCQEGRITKDTVAVIQRSTTIGKEHAFLYRGRALYDWLGHSQVPRNPETRSLILPTDIYRLS